MARKKSMVTKLKEAEKSMRGTTSLFKDTKSGLVIYVRGKKVFMRDPKYAILGTREIDITEAAYRARREYADAVAGKRKLTGAKAEIVAHKMFAKCKSGAEAALKLTKIMKVG